jgi:hypothetical protein
VLLMGASMAVLVVFSIATCHLPLPIPAAGAQLDVIFVESH